MFDILDPRDDARDRDREDDGIRDREDHWLELGRDLEESRDREDSVDRDDRDPDRDRCGLEQREREPRDRDDDRGGFDPRDVFMRDLELPRGEEREIVRDRDGEYSFLGHRNPSTTTRYLNTTSRRLRLALLRVEQARAQSESLANSCKETPDSRPHADDAEASSTPSKSLPS